MAKVYILLGANLGKRFDQLLLARQEIEAHVGNLIQISSIYETAAWGVKEDEPSYLNQVLEVNTELSPLILLETVNAIEKKLGRTRNLKWESRLIDIDILYYDNLVMNTPSLIIPHPYLHLRKFTLVPLVEIAPDFMHPLIGKDSKTLLLELKDELEVKKLPA